MSRCPLYQRISYFLTYCQSYWHEVVTAILTDTKLLMPFCTNTRVNRNCLCIYKFSNYTDSDDDENCRRSILHEVVTAILPDTKLLCHSERTRQRIELVFLCTNWCMYKLTIYTNEDDDENYRCSFHGFQTVRIIIHTGIKLKLISWLRM